MLIKACRDSGFEPDFLIVSRHLADIKQAMAVQGRGVFLCAIPAFMRDYPGVCYVPVRDAPYYVEYYLLWLKENKNPAIPRFAGFLRERFEELDTGI